MTAMFEDGSPVTLGIVRSRQTQRSSLTDSKVGGRPVWFNAVAEDWRRDLRCPQCSFAMEHVFTLYSPIEDVNSKLDRSLIVFACPKQSCCLKSSSWRVFRDQREKARNVPQCTPIIAKKSSTSWDFLLNEDALGQENEDIAYLESLLLNKAQLNSPPTNPSTKENVEITSDGISEGWLVDSITEPHDELVPVEGDRRILSMVEKYLDEEEDDSVRHLIRERCASEKTSAWNEDDGEEDDYSEGDERINRADVKSVVEMNFLRKVSVEPRQVVRYAYGGRPLWCTHPFPVEANDIPQCSSCGADRVFEAQLMPGILDYLNKSEEFKVHDEMGSEEKEGCGNTLDIRRRHLRKQIGFDFGIVAIWSCSESCHSGKEEFCVVQPPSDEF